MQSEKQSNNTKELSTISDKVEEVENKIDTHTQVWEMFKECALENTYLKWSLGISVFFNIVLFLIAYFK